MSDREIQAFRYLDALDCFVVTPEMAAACGVLGLSEWTPVVWMGRLVTRNQDFGEHWFDNWDEREAVADRATGLAVPGWCVELIGDYGELAMTVEPFRFIEHEPRCWKCATAGHRGEPEPQRTSFDRLPCPNCGEAVHVGPDGPCYSDAVVKAFWTAVLKSLRVPVSLLLLLAEEEGCSAERMAAVRESDDLAALYASLGMPPDDDQ